MPDDARGGDRSWLLEPLGANAVRVHVELGEGREVSEEVRTALDAFVHELYAEEVEGFLPRCPELNACGSFYCVPLGKCTKLTKQPCLADVGCVIADLR